MVDTHCHLLPGVDDGPRDDGEAVQLARALLRTGVRTVVCTPHFSRQFPTSRQQAAEGYDRLRKALADAGFELNTSLAAEIGAVFAVDATPDQLRGRAIASRFLLVEARPDTPGVFFAAAARRLADLGLDAIFAHPELSRAVRREPAVLDEVRAEGALVQVVAPSLVGRWGNDVAETAWDLVGSGRADLVASDAHGGRRPASDLAVAAEELERELGTEALLDLTERRPGLVAAGRHPDGREARPAALEAGT
jgi:protein-tyrosine phosphatase